MARRPYRQKPEVERKYVRLELAQGWIVVAAQVVAVLLALVMSVAVCIGALPATTGCPAMAVAVGVAVGVPKLRG
jgi:hypothetical protein